uniref:NADH-ubiquinone oxidoreductase chain 2 n=1 Tax=Ailuronyx seychellensis TaxID=232285 RepID=A0A291I2Q3_9SAUR|nr:NADH dehydrogenase subunit 2 [Ailuronyx seychellensis]
MSPMTWAILITGLSTSTIITMSSHHWILAWIGLELNTLSIMPIIMKPHHPRATEATTKYFLIQTLAAALILFASTMNAWQTGQWSIINTTSNLAATTMTMAIMLKLGLAPIHFWYPEVIQGTTLSTALIISTWQKIAPLTLLYLMMNSLPTNTLLTLGLTSTVIGGLMGLGQTQTRKIMAFSSIAHMGWLVTALTLSPTLSTLTIMMYMILTTTMFSSLNHTQTKTITDLGASWTQSPMLLTLTMATLMSLGGLPPLTGFMPKWLIIKNLTAMDLNLLSVLLTLSTLPSLFFYIRMAYLTTLTSPPHTTNTEHKWRFNTTTTHIALMAAPTTLLLPMTYMLYNTT